MNDRTHNSDDTGAPNAPHEDGGWDAAVVDAEGRLRIVGTAQVIAGLLTLGLLEHAGAPDRLTEALFPHVPPGPARDRAQFLAGAVTGAAVGWRKGRSRWDPAGLDDTADALHEIGAARMASLARTAAHIARPWWQAWNGPPPDRHPAPGDGPDGSGPVGGDR